MSTTKTPAPTYPLFAEETQLVHLHRHWDPDTGEYKGVRIEYEYRIRRFESSEDLEGMIVSREYREANNIHALDEDDQAAIAAAISKEGLEWEKRHATMVEQLAQLEDEKGKVDEELRALKAARAAKAPKFA